MSKHQIHPGDGRWTGRHGVGRLNQRHENKMKGKDGDRKRSKIEKVAERKKILARKWRRRGRQSGASCKKAKQGIEYVRVDGRSQLPRTTSGGWR